MSGKEGEVVTHDAIGARVKRGPDWDWGTQDYHNGAPGEGTIVLNDHPSNDTGWLNVLWDSGNEDRYRIGSDECFDLIYAAPAHDHLMKVLDL